MSFVSDKTGYAIQGNVVSAALKKTTNGGANWTAKPITLKPASSGTNTFAIDAVDKGGTWDTTMNQFIGDNFNALAFSDNMHGVDGVRRARRGRMLGACAGGSSGSSRLPRASA